MLVDVMLFNVRHRGPLVQASLLSGHTCVPVKFDTDGIDTQPRSCYVKAARACEEVNDAIPLTQWSRCLSGRHEPECYRSEAVLRHHLAVMRPTPASSVPPVSYDLDQLVSCFRRLLVLPDPTHTPSGLSQMFRRLPVPGLVLEDLGSPPVSVRSWPRTVLRTTVPEAAIDENRDLHCGERNVYGPPRHARHLRADAIAQTSPVQQSPQFQFWVGVLARLALHTCRNALRTRGRR